MRGTEAEACEAVLKACVPKVTRLTVVSDEGRALELWDVDMTFSLQDDCRTLKIFTKKRSDEAKDLGTKKYRQRVIPDKRRKKPKNRGWTQAEEDYLDSLLDNEE
jgi:hypothetical protein